MDMTVRWIVEYTATAVVMVNDDSNPSERAAAAVTLAHHLTTKGKVAQASVSWETPDGQFGGSIR